MNQEIASKVAHALYDYHTDFVQPMFDAIAAPWWKRWWLRRKALPPDMPLEYMTPEKVLAAYDELTEDEDARAAGDVSE